MNCRKTTLRVVPGFSTPPLLPFPVPDSIDPGLWAAVVLAGGAGKRMRSRVPKVLHPIAGKPMLLHVLAAVRETGVARTVLVVNDEVAKALPDEGSEATGQATLAKQSQPLGTGHALQSAQGAVGDKAEHLLVVNGDMPLLRCGTLQRAMAEHLSSRAAVTIVTCHRPQARGLGRVLRAPDGKVNGVVEERDATPEQLAMIETNEGIYCLDAPWAWAQLAALPRAQNGEYYLTSLAGMAGVQGLGVAAVAAAEAEADETMGVNDRVELARAEAAMRRRIRETLMLSGVTIIDPPSTFIDAGVEIDQDTIIHPHTTLSGATVVGRDCEIGPHSILRDSRTGDGCRVLASVLEESILEDRVEVGPFGHLRPGSYIEEGVHLGNYVEIKNSRIGRGSAIGHFSYIGDATLGRRVNVGAGTITANYDGVNKHETRIGDEVFIGSDSIIVAPVTVHDRAATGAGSVVTKDVPEGALVVGVPARQVPRGKRNDQAQPERT